MAYCTGMGWMEEAIAARGGSVDFRTFMELALYDPGNGYYARGPVRYGRGGDYLTAPTASGWYAAVMARFFGRIGEGVEGLRVIDVASGDGSFLAGLLEAWGGAPPQGLRLVSVERSAALREIQEDRFGSGVVRIVATADEMGPPGEGPSILHASELYDALPVHRVVLRDGTLLELHVAVRDGGLAWLEHPAPEALARHLESRGVGLEDGQVAEICLEAEPLHRRLLEAGGSQGVAVVLDYGYPARCLYDPRGRRGGSLACYSGHRLDRDPLDRPGEKDITAHVDWDSLRRAASAVGWREVALLPLAEFLVRAGLQRIVEAKGFGLEREVDAEAYAKRQEIKRLLDPDGMGSDLKVLIQAVPGMDTTVGTILGL